MVVTWTQVTDTKPKRPVWGLGGAPDGATTAISAWGHLVMLGNEEGLLSRWDTVSGRTTSILTNQATFRSILPRSGPLVCSVVL